MLNEYVIESVRRFEAIGYTERFDCTAAGMRSQQTGVLYPMDAFEVEHVVALGAPTSDTGQILLFALRSRGAGVRGTWVVTRDADLPREARRLVQRLASADPRRTWTRRLPLGPPRAADHVLDGLMAGVIGASTVALWFLLVDGVLREPLFTPSLVGNRLLGSGLEPHELAIDLASVSLFAVIHGVLFMLFGVAAAWFVARHVSRPRFPALCLGLFVPLQLGFYAGTELLIADVARVIGHWAILGGNVLAAAGMAVYLRWFQPHPADPREAFAPREDAARVTHTA
jgi:hypothetical protein